MASTYTCRVCSRAILGRQSILTPALRAPVQLLPKETRRGRSRTGPIISTALSPEAYEKNIKRPITKPEGPTLRETLKGKVKEYAPEMVDSYAAYGVTEQLLKECMAPGEYEIPAEMVKAGEIPTDGEGTHVGVGIGWWYEELGLPPTFNSWAQITFLHIFLLQVRLRMLPAAQAPTWIGNLTNHLFWAAEDRLVLFHAMNTASLRQRHLKDLHSNWRAVLLSYDEGLVKGDAMLAAAIWRNLFNGRQDVDFAKVAMVVAYLRRELRRVTMADAQEVLGGEWKFEGHPAAEADEVRKPANEFLKALQEMQKEGGKSAGKKVKKAAKEA